MNAAQSQPAFCCSSPYLCKRKGWAAVTIRSAALMHLLPHDRGQRGLQEHRKHLGIRSGGADAAA